jgi:hypothetical protein
LRNKKAAEKKEKENSIKFGFKGLIAFTWPRVWHVGCMTRVNLILSFLSVMFVKSTSILLPLILKEVVDSIVCDPEKKRQDWLFNFSDKKCRSNEEVYILIGVYALTKLFTDMINYLRELPFAYVGAKVET